MKGITAEKLATKLRKLREEVDMEQEIVARVLEIPRPAVSSYENGKRDITAMELVYLCKLFRTSPNELLGWGTPELAPVSVARPSPTQTGLPIGIVGA